uniref:Uncharacterized protein n=1 Tax=Rousettus aegyptiacus TaxID=9407 RepID=A0A7J8CIC2_ROUAE|nr:hypothetical protein HJG63_009099 [Rousettus aegyptiacus]
MRCGRWLAAARMRLCLSARARREAGARAALEISDTENEKDLTEGSISQEVAGFGFKPKPVSFHGEPTSFPWHRAACLVTHERKQRPQISKRCCHQAGGVTSPSPSTGAIKWSQPEVRKLSRLARQVKHRSPGPPFPTAAETEFH